MITEKFVPEVLTYLFEEWSGSTLLSMGPLCYRFESPRRKLIKVTTISISIENRISGLLPLSLTCNFPYFVCRHSMRHIPSITKICHIVVPVFPLTCNFLLLKAIYAAQSKYNPTLSLDFLFLSLTINFIFGCRHSMRHILSINQILSMCLESLMAAIL